MRHALRWIVALAGLGILLASPAAAAPSTANFLVFVTAGTTIEQVVPNGGSAAVDRLSFKAGAIVDNDGGGEATARLRYTLPSGLRFGRDGPDATEGCSSTGSTAECATPLTIGTDPSRRSIVWAWDVVADRAGSYLLKAEIIQTSVADPDLTSNAASATIVVSEPSGSEVTPAPATASAVRLSPAKPEAGSAVTATVRVTAGGERIRPTRLACAGSIGGAKLRGTPRSAPGSAMCVYRPAKGSKGKALRGTVSFTARGTPFARRFSVKLG